MSTSSSVFDLKMELELALKFSTRQATWYAYQLLAKNPSANATELARLIRESHPTSSTNAGAMSAAVAELKYLFEGALPLNLSYAITSRRLIDALLKSAANLSEAPSHELNEYLKMRKTNIQRLIDTGFSTEEKETQQRLEQGQQKHDVSWLLAHRDCLYVCHQQRLARALPGSIPVVEDIDSESEWLPFKLGLVGENNTVFKRQGGRNTDSPVDNIVDRVYRLSNTNEMWCTAIQGTPYEGEDYTARNVERYMHGLFAMNRVRGEWHMNYLTWLDAFARSVGCLVIKPPSKDAS